MSATTAPGRPSGGAPPSRSATAAPVVRRAPLVPAAAGPRAAPRHATHRWAGPGGAPGWRLTRRGRLLLTAGAAVAAAGLGWAAAPQVLHPLPAAVAGSWGERVTVRPGDTLWELAARAAPQEDPRVVVEEIVERNGLRSTAVAAGDRLLLPSPSS